MTAALAVYAAVVATGALAWNVVSWWLDRRTRLTGDSDYVPEIPALTISLVNHSAHPVRIATINLLWSSGDTHGGRLLTADAIEDGSPTWLRAVGPLPDWIAARDSAFVHVVGPQLTAALPAEHDNLRTLVSTADGVSLEFNVVTEPMERPRPAGEG